MPRKSYSTERIVTKLRQAEVELGRGLPPRLNSGRDVPPGHSVQALLAAVADSERGTLKPEERDGDDAERRDALEHPHHGQGDRHEPHHGRPHLAHVRLQHHVTESFKLSPDLQMVAKVRDVVGLYMHPPYNAVVFAVDEKFQIQVLQRAQPILPMDIGHSERQIPTCLRHGTVDTLCRAERGDRRGDHAVEATVSGPGLCRVPPRRQRLCRGRAGGPRGVG